MQNLRKRPYRELIEFVEMTEEQRDALRARVERGPEQEFPLPELDGAIAEHEKRLFPDANFSGEPRLIRAARVYGALKANAEYSKRQFIKSCLLLVVMLPIAALFFWMYWHAVRLCGHHLDITCFLSTFPLHWE